MGRDKVYVLQSMSNNPTSPYFVRFAKEYDRSDCRLEFLMLCNEEPTLSQEVEQYGCKVHWIPFDMDRRKRSYFIALIAGIKVLRKLRPDILHVHLFDDALPLLIAAKIVGIKHRVITKLDAGFHIYNKPSFVVLDKLNNRLSSRLVLVSKDNWDTVANHERPELSKMRLIHQGFEINSVIGQDLVLQEALKKKFEIGDLPVFLTVSRFIELKGYDYLLEALQKVKASGLEFKAILVGYGDNMDLYQTKAEELGLKANVVFSGWVDRHTLNNLYSISELFIHAALVEPFGFVIAEAMANRLPSVLTKVGAASDAVEHLEAGYLCNTRDSEDLARGIRTLLEVDTSNMVENAYSKVEEFFSIERMWSKHLDLYKELLDESPV